MHEGHASVSSAHLTSIRIQRDEHVLPPTFLVHQEGRYPLAMGIGTFQQYQTPQPSLEFHNRIAGWSNSSQDNEHIDRPYPNDGGAAGPRNRPTAYTGFPLLDRRL